MSILDAIKLHPFDMYVNHQQKLELWMAKIPKATLPGLAK